MSEAVAERTDRRTEKRVKRRFHQFARVGVVLVLCGSVAAGAYLSRDRWLGMLVPARHEHSAGEAHEHGEASGPSEQVLLSPQAQKNLRLTAKPLKAESFWKTLSVPGMVVDRAGFSDRSVVAPVNGIVSRIHRVSGDTTRPGETLFTLKLLSESLHLTQTDFFKSTQDIKLAQAQRKRLADSAFSGAVPVARTIEVDNQITRLEVAVKAYRQELLNRGLLPDQIDRVAEGTFVNEIPIVVPLRPADPVSPTVPPAKSPDAVTSTTPPVFEIQELKVELGQYVQAGQTLCLLANHQMLSIEGRAFRDESPLMERSVKEGWPVEVDFAEEKTHEWPTLNQTFAIHHISNTIDPETRTFHFMMRLDNQSRLIDREGHKQILWRFRPGQRVRLLVRVEKIDNVFILPMEAVARKGADAFVFRQNGDVFDRKPVQVVYRDRQHVVIANDGSVPAGIYVAQTGATQMNRMIKSQSGALPRGFHIHADGSVHMGKD